jgi:RNA polymerase-interacting CarD/CdnL/TRCF family regulator
MTNIQSLKVGDKIIRFGKVYEIFKLVEEKNPETEELEKIIYFKPVYESQDSQTLICSIALSNLDLTDIRRPLSEDEVDELLDFLRSKIEMKSRFNTRSAKELIKSNEPKKIAMILKKLAIVRRDPDTNFTYTKKRLFKSALKKLQEEVALVKGTSTKEAQEMIIEILKQQAAKSFILDDDDDLDD